MNRNLLVCGVLLVVFIVCAACSYGVYYYFVGNPNTVFLTSQQLPQITWTPGVPATIQHVPSVTGTATATNTISPTITPTATPMELEYLPYIQRGEGVVVQDPIALCDDLGDLSWAGNPGLTDGSLWAVLCSKRHVFPNGDTAVLFIGEKGEYLIGNCEEPPLKIPPAGTVCRYDYQSATIVCDADYQDFYPWKWFYPN